MRYFKFLETAEGFRDRLERKNEPLRDNHPGTIFRGFFLQVVIFQVEFAGGQSSGGQSSREKFSGGKSPLGQSACGQSFGGKYIDEQFSGW